jgi:hypothetical protein
VGFVFAVQLSINTSAIVIEFANSFQRFNPSDKKIAETGQFRDKRAMAWGLLSALLPE